MEKVLSQEEIDAMVKADRGGTLKVPVQPVVAAEKWDLRQAGRIGRERTRAISLLHESFARNLTNSLGAYLRSAFVAALVSAEHLKYSDFLRTIPEVAYLANCQIKPLEVPALLQLDLAVAFPMVDVLLGGQGKGTTPTREITAIEELILETVMRIICRELQVAWQSLQIEFQFGQRQQPEQAQHLLPNEEKTLSLSFEITMAESRGTLSIAVPATISNALLRKISAEWTTSRARPMAEVGQQIRERLMSCPFEVGLGVPSLTVSLRDLIKLKPGNLLIFDRGIQDGGALMVTNRPLFHARAVKKGAKRAAHVLQIVNPRAASEERHG
ncbi:MAG TPA: FliM/FliN family flagellar motor switch protein [Terriglobales bacterium]|nr:FliM/FliN family flagellar motor switch protein [Terriglobales bacterium]